MRQHFGGKSGKRFSRCSIYRCGRPTLAPVELDRLAQAFAHRAGPEGTVVAEEVGLRLHVIGPAPTAPPAADVRLRFRAGRDPAPSEPVGKRGFDRVSASFGRVAAPDEPVDDDLERSASGRPGRAVRVSRPGHGRHSPKARARSDRSKAAWSVRGSVHPGERRFRRGCRRATLDRVRYGCRRRRGNALAAVAANDLTDSGQKQGERVVHLTDRADSTSASRKPLGPADRDCRGDAGDRVSVRLVELCKELASVRRKGFDVASLSLGVKGVESQRALAGAAGAGHDDQPTERQVEVEPFEIMSSYPAEGDRRQGVGQDRV